jgi:hypothetical protein
MQLFVPPFFRLFTLFPYLSFPSKSALADFVMKVPCNSLPGTFIAEKTAYFALTIPSV